MIKKEKFIQFWQWINKQKRLKINFLLLLVILLLAPTQNYYTRLEIRPGKPVIRETDYKIETISDYPVNKTEVEAPSLTASSVIILCWC
jgi:hypothetical protein